MTPKQAAEQAVRCFDSGENCAAGIWLDVAQSLIWDTLANVIADQLDQIAIAENGRTLLCWDCLLARRAIVELLEAAVEG